MKGGFLLSFFGRLSFFLSFFIYIFVGPNANWAPQRHQKEEEEKEEEEEEGA